MNFKKITMRLQTTSRGGGIEINLSTLGFEGHKMSAYQNYLGGGMLGAIQVNDTIRANASDVRLQLEFSDRFKELDAIGERLMKYFHDITKDSSDEDATFEQNQTRPARAY